MPLQPPYCPVGALILLVESCLTADDLVRVAVTPKERIAANPGLSRKPALVVEGPDVVGVGGGGEFNGRGSVKTRLASMALDKSVSAQDRGFGASRRSAPQAMFAAQNGTELLGAPSGVRFSLRHDFRHQRLRGLAGTTPRAARQLTEICGSFAGLTTPPLMADLASDVEVLASLRDDEAASGHRAEELHLLKHNGHFFPGHKPFVVSPMSLDFLLPLFPAHTDAPGF